MFSSAWRHKNWFLSRCNQGHWPWDYTAVQRSHTWRLSSWHGKQHSSSPEGSKDMSEDDSPRMLANILAIVSTSVARCCRCSVLRQIDDCEPNKQEHSLWMYEINGYYVSTRMTFNQDRSTAVNNVQTDFFWYGKNQNWNSQDDNYHYISRHREKSGDNNNNNGRSADVVVEDEEDNRAESMRCCLCCAVEACTLFESRRMYSSRHDCINWVDFCWSIPCSLTWLIAVYSARITSAPT